MVIAIIGIIIGIGLGFLIPFEFSTIYSIYFSVGILAAIDSVLGAIRANMQDGFDSLVFISGFVVNVLLAIFLSYIGDRLGVPIYYAAIFVFGTRLFNNLGIIRNMTIEKYREKKSKAQDLKKQ